MSKEHQVAVRNVEDWSDDLAWVRIQRDKVIRTAVRMGVPLREVAAAAGVSPMTVKRIAERGGDG